MTVCIGNSEANIARTSTQHQQPAMHFDDSKIELLRDTICKGANEQEFELFVHACQRTGLDPFARQIFAVKRWDSNLKRESMTVQTGIDGYRLIADRSGCYAPGKESVYAYKSDGTLLSATAYVKKRTIDGTWHEISSTVFFEEYCQRTKDGKPMAMWARMPHVMLAKCAEAVALRRAFPAELSGIYTSEEMSQADTGAEPIAVKTLIKPEEAKMLEGLINFDSGFKESILERLRKQGIHSLDHVTTDLYPKLVKYANEQWTAFMTNQEAAKQKENEA